MQGDVCPRHVELVQSTRNKPNHNARKMSKIRTLGECLLKVKGVNIYWKNGTKMSYGEIINEG